MWVLDGVQPGRWDLAGAGVTLLGMAVLLFSPCPLEDVVPPKQTLQPTRGASLASRGSNSASSTGD